MGSKLILFVGLFLAMALLISSQESAEWNDPVQMSPDIPNDPPPTGRVCQYGCCGSSSHNSGCICCSRRGQQPSTPANRNKPPPGTKG